MGTKEFSSLHSCIYGWSQMPHMVRVRVPSVDGTRPFSPRQQIPFKFLLVF